MAGGTILAIQPVLIPFLAVIFLACLLPTGMVSLGSVTMAALYPVLTILYGVFRGYSAADLTVCAIGSVIMGAMVIYMHRSNIQRIREGKEYRSVTDSKHFCERLPRRIDNAVRSCYVSIDKSVPYRALYTLFHHAAAAAERIKP